MNLTVKTASGAVYEIRNGICYKTSSDGYKESPFKVYAMRAVSPEFKSLEEIYEAERSKPEVGKLFYVSGRDEWWLSTEVVSVEFSEKEDRDAGPEDADS